mmetsp:Transcript_30876/g.61136  ORF Transcript_30876/g.61136 Transcript_30876/m.61136 type:complete len:335 (-) Transcript_30876:152-1156(-)
MVCISVRYEEELDNLRGMVEKDHHSYGCHDQSHLMHASKSANYNDNKIYIVKCRDTVCDWCYNIVDHFNIRREVVYIAMSYLDRYARRKGNSRTIPTFEYRLAAITSLYLAIKLNEQKIIKISSFVHLSRGIVTESQIIAMERSLLCNSDWLMNPPTPHAFSSLYFSLLQSSVFVSNNSSQLCDEFSTYLIELSVGDSSFVGLPAYAIAIASIYASVQHLVQNSLESSDDTFENIKQNLEETVALPDKADEYINAAKGIFCKLMSSTEKISKELMTLSDDKRMKDKRIVLKTQENECRKSPSCIPSMNKYILDSFHGKKRTLPIEIEHQGKRKR